MTAWSSRELSPLLLLRDIGSWFSWVEESQLPLLVTARSWSILLLMILQTTFPTPLFRLASEAGNYKSDKKFAKSLCADRNESHLKQIVSFCPFQSKPGEVSQPQAQTLVP